MNRNTAIRGVNTVFTRHIILIIIFSIIVWPFRLVAENLPFDTSNPFIWDNDSASDCFDQELVMVLANNGTINLIGITESPDPFKTTSENYQDYVGKALNVGLTNIPDANWNLGDYYMTALAPPDDGVIEDTQPLDTAPARMILDRVLHHGTPSKPVVVGAGGALTNIASAYLLAINKGKGDEFASKVIVIADIGNADVNQPSVSGFNTYQDEWAAYICIQRLKMVIDPDGADSWATVWDYIANDLPDNELTQWMRSKQLPQNWPYPGQYDSSGDNSVVFLFLFSNQGKYFTSTTRVSFDSWADWPSTWPQEQGPGSLNWNTYQQDMNLVPDDISNVIYVSGFVPGVATAAYKDAFDKAFRLYPQLRITVGGTGIEVRWPASTIDWTLQTSTTQAIDSWTTIPGPFPIDVSDYVYSLTPSDPCRFFRPSR